MSAVIHSGRLQQRLKKNQDDSEDEDSQEGDFFERPAAPSSHHAPPRWPEGATRKMTSWTPLLTIARRSLADRCSPITTSRAVLPATIVVLFSSAILAVGGVAIAFSRC